MLALKPNCECCDTDLPPASAEARICTFECTFCADCAQGRFDGVCPNCGGGRRQVLVAAFAVWAQRQHGPLLRSQFAA